MKSFLLSVLLGLALLAQPVFAERPKIGLALAGGGAKGSAHIAVLEFLEANNIPVDYITGTSIGAYIGGLYALGYNAGQIKTIVYEQDLNRGYSDAIPRKNLPLRKKRQNDKFNMPVEAGYRAGQIRLPSGLLYGQTLSSIYRSSAGNVVNLKSFDELAIPFRAIATDLSTSESVVLGSGNLIKAMQASATVPGALVPVEIDGKYLVDGGISNNIPIAEVKQMGADIVIAVDISSPLLSKKSLDNSFAIFRQVSTFLTIKNISEQKLLLNDNDIYIRPKLDGLKATDFENWPKAYEAGRLAVEQQLQQLEKLAISADDYRKYVAYKQQALAAINKTGAQPVVEIILPGQPVSGGDYLREVLNLHRDTEITTEALTSATERVYGLDKFERVSAEFELRDKDLTLIIDAEEKSWGPNFFEMGLSWEDDFTLDSIVNLDFAYTMGKITDNGGEWRNEIGIGTNKSFTSELYFPLGRSRKFYHSEVLEFQRVSRDYFINNQRAVIFDQGLNRYDFSLGYNYSIDARLEFGVTIESGEISNQLVLQEDLIYRSKGLFFRATYDSLDRISFPTQGNRFDFSIRHREEDVSGDYITGASATRESYFSTRYNADWKGAISEDNQGLVGKLSVTYLDSESDQSVFFEPLGGFLNLSGYHKNALVGNSKIFAGLSYQYDLGKSVFGLKDFPLYIGASVEAGNVWLTSETIKLDRLIAAGSLFLGTHTALGPVALGFGFSEQNVNSVYFYLGKNIL